jgi:MYXO-CTERM domain-containing protein
VTIVDAAADPTGDLNVIVTPPDSATDVPVTTVITATSTDSSDIASVFNANTFALRVDSITMSATRAGDEEHYWSRDDDDDDSDCIRSGVVVGNIAYDAGGITATFTPDCKLAHGVTYTATITPAVSVQQGSAAAAPLSWSFTTTARTSDTDDDGVQDGEDDHPDDDGEATPHKSRGKGKFRLSVKRHPGSRLRNVTGISDTHSGINQAGKPAGYEFRDGLVEYEIQGVPPGGTVEVDLTLPEPVPAGSKVYTAGSAGFREIAGTAIQGGTVTLKLTDGGAGDSDGVANGVIVNPVGVAAPVASGGGSVDLSTGSSSGGGCTVAPGNASGGAGAMVPLLLLLVGAAVRRLRKPGRKQ